jgi:hypothetical protein
MKISDLSSGVGQLTQSYAKLNECWVEVKDSWNDGVRREFEETHLAEIPLRVRQVLSAAQRLAEVLDQARRDLDDRPLET